MQLGRPSSYDPIKHNQIDAYFLECGREQTELPTIEGLAEYLGINPDTVYDWRGKYPEFSESIKRLLAKQKAQLMNDGLYGGKEVNSTMAIFLLKVNHEMVETTHTDITSKGEKLEAPHITLDVKE